MTGNYMKWAVKTVLTITVLAGLLFEFRQVFLEVDAAMTIPPLRSFMQNQTIDPIAHAFIPSTVQPFASATKWYVYDVIDPMYFTNQQLIPLVVFWNKDCPSCVAMIPTLNAWQKKYQKKGLSIVSIYEPSVDENQEELATFIQQQDLNYRVAYDETGLIRQSYGAEVWPALYFFAKELKPVRVVFGDRGLDELESEIRTVIGWTGLDEHPVAYEDPNVVPGSAKRSRFDSPELIVKESEGFYSFPASLEPKHFALSGGWIIRGEEVESTEKDAAIRFRFYGTGVSASLDMADNQQHFPTIKIDGHYLTSEEAGRNVGVYAMEEGRSYITLSYYLQAELAKLTAGDHLLEIIADAPGLRVHFLGPVESE